MVFFRESSALYQIVSYRYRIVSYRFLASIFPFRPFLANNHFPKKAKIKFIDFYQSIGEDKILD